MSKASKGKNKKIEPKKVEPKKRNPWPIVAGIVVIVIIIIAGALVVTSQKGHSSTTTTATGTGLSSSGKVIILYVDQGNALVDMSNYSAFLNYAKAHGFNTVFFQIYRSGNLLFNQGNLTDFVTTAHIEGLKIYFSLYFTSSSQPIPSLIYSLGEDGINLDMSNLTTGSQGNLLQTLQQNYKGQTAVTTTNFTTTLKPDLLILETYSTSDKTYIRPGIIASVEPLALSSKSEYTSQYNYALSNSNGVMVFDYYGLLKTGY